MYNFLQPQESGSEVDTRLYARQSPSRMGTIPVYGQPDGAYSHRQGHGIGLDPMLLLASATQEKLLAAGNQAFCSLYHENVKLKAELALKDKMILFYKEQRQPSTSVPSSSTDPNHATNHTTKGALALLRPPIPLAPPSLKREDYPDAKRFWKKKGWINYEASRRSNDESIPRLGFLINEKGIPVSKARSQAMYAEACALWTTLYRVREDPRSWTKKTDWSSSFFSNSMRIKFIEFRLCEDDWKIEKYCTIKYPDWDRGLRQSGKLIREVPSSPGKETTVVKRKKASTSRSGAEGSDRPAKRARKRQQIKYSISSSSSSESDGEGAVFPPPKNTDKARNRSLTAASDDALEYMSPRPMSEPTQKWPEEQDPDPTSDIEDVDDGQHHRHQSSPSPSPEPRRTPDSEHHVSPVPPPTERSAATNRTPTPPPSPENDRNQCQQTAQPSPSKEKHGHGTENQSQSLGPAPLTASTSTQKLTIHIQGGAMRTGARSSRNRNPLANMPIPQISADIAIPEITQASTQPKKSTPAALSTSAAPKKKSLMVPTDKLTARNLYAIDYMKTNQVTSKEFKEHWDALKEDKEKADIIQKYEALAKERKKAASG